MPSPARPSSSRSSLRQPRRDPLGASPLPPPTPFGRRGSILTTPGLVRRRPCLRLCAGARSFANGPGYRGEAIRGCLHRLGNRNSGGPCPCMRASQTSLSGLRLLRVTRRSVPQARFLSSRSRSADRSSRFGLWRSGSETHCTASDVISMRVSCFVNAVIISYVSPWVSAGGADHLVD